MRRRNRIIGRSPSFMAMNRTRLRALANGGVTQDFSTNVENIREISRKLGYDICNGKGVSSTNLVLWSEDFTNAIWNKVGSTVIINTNLNPFNINKSYYLQESNTNSTHSIGNSNNIIVSGNTYTSSYYIKKGDASWIQLIGNGVVFGSNNWVNFNFDTGLFGNNGGVGNWSAILLSNGYWLVTLTSTAIANGTVDVTTLFGCNNTNTSIRAQSYIGTTGYNIADIAAVQFELGTTATPYIKTTTTPLSNNPTAPASFIYVPSSYGEGKNFAQVHNKRNLLQWSEDFSNAVWLRNNLTITANTIIAPDGTLTADSLFETASTSVHQSFVISNSVTAGIIYTYSIYVKYNGRSIVNMNLATTPFGSNDAYYDLIAETVTYTGTATNAEIKLISNGWYRLSITATAVSTVSGNNCFIRTVLSGTTITFTGDITKGVYVWGAQLEQGAYATPYQKTVASGDGIVDFNFTRATSARVTNNLGVIEDSCYNLIQRSEEFDNASWTKESSIATANVISNPVNGSVTADKISINTNSTVVSARLYLGANLVQDNSIKTYSFWVKKAELDFIHFRISQSVNYGFCVDLNTGIITQGRYDGANISTLPTSYSAVKNPDNGWILVTTTFNTTTTINPIIYLATSATTTSVTGQLNNGVYIFGAQLVQSSTPRPYLRTTNRLNVPRLNYSRGTGEPELLIERASTNIRLQSEDFTQAAWTKLFSTVTLNSTLNPFNSNKSYYINETTTTERHGITNATAGIVVGTAYTASYYIKKADVDWIQLVYGSTSFGTLAFANFNFTTGNFGFIGSNASVTKKQLINGYWLLTLTSIATVSGSSGTGAIFGTNNTDLNQYAPVDGLYLGNSSIKLCDISAIQVEAGSIATTYIPTTTVAVTRNAETSYVDLWNNSLLNSTNWTLFWEGYLYDGSGAGMSFCLSDTTTAATNTNQIGWDNSLRPFYNIGNSRKNRISEASSNTFNRFAIQYNNGVVNYYVNDINVWSNQSVPVLNYRYLVLNSGGSTFTTDKITLFNRTLTDIECSILTINSIRPDFSMYDVDFQKVLKTAYDNGFTLPNSTKLGIMNQLMIDIKSIGMFSIADTIINPCINDTALGDFARIDWKIPRNVYSSNGGLTYEVSGYKGNSSNAYLGSNYIASNMNQFYTLNNAGRLIVAYSTTTGFLEGSSNTAGAGEGMIGVNSNAQRITTYSSALSPTVSMSGIGTKSINRDDSTNIRIYNNAVETLHTASSTGSSTVEFTVFKRFDSYGNGGASFYYIGGSMSNTMVQNFRTAYNTYLTAIGLTAFA